MSVLKGIASIFPFWGWDVPTINPILGRETCILRGLETCFFQFNFTVFRISGSDEIPVTPKKADPKKHLWKQPFLPFERATNNLKALKDTPGNDFRDYN